MGGGAPAQDHTASNKLAAINREMFDYWKTKFKPLEGDLIKEMNDPNLITGSVNRSKGIVSKAFTAGDQSQQREMQRYGVQATPQRATSISRANNLSQGLTTVSAANRTRAATDQYKTGVLNGIGGLGRQTAGNAVAGFGTAASLESQRNRAAQQAQAQSDEALWDGIGQVAGIGAAFI